MNAPAPRMPCLFLGHGSPLNVLDDNPFTRTWQRLGRELPRPRAILAVSAHWCTHGVGVTAMVQPPTLHDFGGFSREMFEIQYPAPGSPALAARVAQLLAPKDVVQDHAWGLDHGTWSVLCKAYPAADIPVVQLSLDMRRTPGQHLQTGRQLAPLRDESVLILGSGNVVHNLMTHRRGEAFAYDWAERFNDQVRERLLAGDHEALADDAWLGDAGRLSVPTPEHYLPLLVVAGAAGADAPTVEIDGVLGGSIGMLSVSFGRH
ncbi:4,5-DOPA dioxygenase extradiol [Hydrogenophaga sp. BPS33]|uniref:4,5-DOPA-extradiol-dioxygenase n=1 Tax=Hydrogenophaga sp. BPS33 TaxID=2651974 RepID=UPI00131F823A|nr:4,5-DOPA dioxygenase extradiol [Hydrogenophaga sp. BPS33]QHE83510.1 4,5-DOPA dioxygenase extradiol [Hydrogenophaga sp. BPS33]